MKRLLLIIYIFSAFLLTGNTALAQERDSVSTDRYEMSVWPNPFENEVTITLIAGNKNLTAVRISNILGTEVAYIDLRNRSGAQSYRLDFSQLPGGFYICSVYGTEGIIETRRLSHKK